jgi:hypothetical protein
MTDPEYVGSLNQQQLTQQALTNPSVQAYLAKSPAHAAAVGDNVGFISSLLQSAQKFTSYPGDNIAALTHAELERQRRNTAGQMTDREKMYDIIGQSMIGNAGMREGINQVINFGSVGLKGVLDIQNPIGSRVSDEANAALERRVGPDWYDLLQNVATIGLSVLPFALKGAAPEGALRAPPTEPPPPGGPTAPPPIFKTVQGGVTEGGAVSGGPIRPVVNAEGAPLTFSSHAQAAAFEKANPGQYTRIVDSAGNIRLYARGGPRPTLETPGPIKPVSPEYKGEFVPTTPAPEYFGEPLLDDNGEHVTFGDPQEMAKWIDENPAPAGKVYNANQVGNRLGLYTQAAPDYIGEPPLGHSETTDLVQGAVAEDRAAVLADTQDRIAKNPLHAALPAEDLAELLGTDPDVAGKTVSIDAKALGQLAYSGLMDSDDFLEFIGQPGTRAHGAFMQAVANGTSVDMPLADYLAQTAGKPWAEAVNELAQHSDGGYSVQQVKDMGVSHGDTAIPKGEAPPAEAATEPKVPEPEKPLPPVQHEEGVSGEAEGNPAGLSQALLSLAAEHGGEIPLAKLTNTQQETLKAAGYSLNAENGAYVVNNYSKEVVDRMSKGQWGVTEPEAEHPVRESLNELRGAVKPAPPKPAPEGPFDIDDMPDAAGEGGAAKGSKLNPLKVGKIPAGAVDQNSDEYYKAAINPVIETVPFHMIFSSVPALLTGSIKNAFLPMDTNTPLGTVQKWMGQYYATTHVSQAIVKAMSLGETGGVFKVTDLDAAGLGLSDEDALALLGEAKPQEGEDLQDNWTPANPSPVAQSEEDLATHNFAPEKAGAVTFTSLNELTYVGAKTQGFSPGGLYKDASGQVWLVKGNPAPHLPDGDERAANEVLASYLYNAAIPGSAPEIRLIHLGDMYNGGFGVASKIISGLSPELDVKNEDHVKAARKLYALHAWLLNRDAIGQFANNTLIHLADGTAVAVDVGGAVRYKGAGQIKPDFNFDPKQWHSFRTESGSQTMFPFYGDITDEELLEAASFLKNVTNSKIHRLVDQFGPEDKDDNEELRNKLIVRRDRILEEAGKLGQVPNPPSQFNPVPIQADPNLSAKENEALALLAPTIKIAAKQAVEEVHLQALFGDGITLKMTKRQLRNWDVKVLEAQQAVYDGLLKKAKAKILAFRKEEWKKAYQTSYSATYQEFMMRPEVMAYNQLKFASANEAIDFTKDNALVGADGKPITFYRVDNLTDVLNGELPVDLFANPRTPQHPHPYWSNLTTHSTYGGASLTESIEFAKRWAKTGKGEYHAADPNHWSGPQPAKQPTTLITYVKTTKVGDFRKKEDLDRVIEWWKKKNPQPVYETAQTYGQRISDARKRFAAGNYGPWEVPHMLQEIGWDAVRMLEDEYQPRDKPNLYVINPETIYWKYDVGSVPTKIKLDIKQKGDYSKELLAQLPKGIWAKGGEDVQAFAEGVNMQSGQALLEKLAEIEKSRGKTGFKKWLEQQIKIEAGKRAQDSLGWDLSPAAILEEARASVPDPQVETLLTTAMHDLAAKLGPGVQFTREAVKAAALAQWETLPVKDAIRVDKFRKDVWMTMQKVERGVLDDTPKSILQAFTARLHALEALYKLERATSFAKFWMRNDTRFKRYARTTVFKGVNPEWWYHVLKTLQASKYPIKANLPELEAQFGPKATQQFVDEQNAAGRQVDYIEPLGNFTEPKEMPAVEFEALHHSIKSLVGNGKQVDKYLKGLKKISLTGIRRQVSSDIIRRGYKYPSEEAKQKRFRDVMKRGLDPLLVRPETFWFDAGGQDPQSAANIYINHPMQVGKHLETKLQKLIQKKFDAVNKTLPRSFSRSLSNKIPKTPELRFVDQWGREHYPIDTVDALMHAVLHLGNDYNANVLLKGYRYNRADLFAVAEKYLNEHHLKMINFLWEVNEFLWPYVATTYRKLNGFAPKKYAAVPFKIGETDMTGGYEQLVYNRTIAPNLHRGFSANSLFGPDYNSALPANPFAKLRTGYVGPLLLNLDTVMFNIRQKIHDIAYRSVLLDVGSIVLDPQVQSAITAHYGPEFAKEQKSWLQYVARGSVFSNENTSWAKKWVQQARGNITASALMFQATVPQKHFFTALGNSASVVGGLPLLGAILKTAVTPHQMLRKYQEMYNESVEMQTRWINLDRDLVAHAQTTMSRQNNVLFAWQMMGYMGIALSDLFSSSATYSAAKQQALKEGYSPEWAVFRAEQAVRFAHGSNDLPDLPAILRQQETLLAEIGFTVVNMFTSFLNVTYNRTWMMRRSFQQARAEGRIARALGEDSDEASRANFYFAKGMANLFYALILPGVAIGVIQHEHQPKAQHFRMPWTVSIAAGLAEQSVGDIPIVSQTVHYMADLGQGQVTDPMEALELESFKVTYDSVASFLDDTGLAKTWWGRPLPIKSLTLDDALRFGGVFTPFSNVGAWHIGDFVYHEMTGTMPPEGVDFMQAMAHGVDHVKLFHQPPRASGGRGGGGRGGGGRGR